MAGLLPGFCSMKQLRVMLLKRPWAVGKIVASCMKLCLLTLFFLTFLLKQLSL